MCTNFGLAGIPGTRLKVCVWVVVVGWWITYPLPYNTSPRLGAWSLNLRLGLDCYKNEIKIKNLTSKDTTLPILWVDGADTTKIMPPKLSWAYRYLLHIEWKLFCFYYKFKFCFPDIFRVVGGADTKDNAIQA